MVSVSELFLWFLTYMFGIGVPKFGTCVIIQMFGKDEVRNFFYFGIWNPCLGTSSEFLYVPKLEQKYRCSELGLLFETEAFPKLEGDVVMGYGL